jgi:hypothetical protein
MWMVTRSQLIAVDAGAGCHLTRLEVLLGFPGRLPPLSVGACWLANDCLPRNIVLKQRTNLLRECDCAAFRALHGLVFHRSAEANQSSVRTIHLDDGGHEIELGPILTGNNAIVSLVPIQHQLLVQPFAYQVAVHRDRGPVATRQIKVARLNRHPTCTRQAVLRRMNVVAGRRESTLLFSRTGTGRVYVVGPCWCGSQTVGGAPDEIHLNNVGVAEISVQVLTVLEVKKELE